MTPPQSKAKRIKCWIARDYNEKGSTHIYDRKPILWSDFYSAGRAALTINLGPSGFGIGIAPGQCVEAEIVVKGKRE